MATLTLNSGELWYGNTNRIVTAYIEVESNSGEAKYRIHSECTTSQQPWTSIELQYKKDGGSWTRICYDWGNPANEPPWDKWTWYPVGKDCWKSSSSSSVGDPNTWMTYSPVEETGRIYFRLLVGAGTATVTERDSGYIDLIVNPTITSVLCEETSTPGQVHYKVEASPGSSPILGYQWAIGSISSSLDEGYINNFAENKLVGWWVRVSGEDGGTATTSGAFYISHTTKPSITNVSYRNGTRSGTTYVNDTYTGYIEYHKEYTGDVDFYSHSLEYGISDSYGSIGETTDTGSDVTWTLNNLQPNTTYYYRIKEKDNGQTKLEETVTGTFTTTGIKPKINSISSTRGYIDYTFDIDYSLDNTTLYPTNPITISMGQYNSTQGRVIYTITQYFDDSPCTVTGLESGQEYYVKTTIKDAKGRSISSESYPSTSFTTGIRPPLAVGLTKNGATVNAMGVRINYQRDPGPLQVRYSVSCSNGDEVSSNFYYDYDTRYADVNFYNLIGDTDYTFNGMVATVAGAKTATQIQFSTAMPTPTINNLDVIALDPFSIQATITASISPSRTFLYRFSSNGGSTWTDYQSSPVYLFTNLTPETSYCIMGEAKALHEASQTNDATARRSVTCTTPADQASVRLKQNDLWQHGKVWFKKDGEWVKAKKVYIKDNGTWRINNNN